MKNDKMPQKLIIFIKLLLLTVDFFSGFYYCEISGNSRFSGKYDDVHPEAYYKLDVQC